MTSSAPASELKEPHPQGNVRSPHRHVPPGCRVVPNRIAGGMAGWQITMIALGAALFAAAATLVLERYCARRNAVAATA